MIVIDWPIAAWPNPNRDRRKHWTRERREAREIRSAAHVLGCQSGLTFTKPVNVTVTWAFPDKRRRDADNFSCKALIDGLVDAGVLADDDTTRVLSLTKRIDTTARTPKGHMRATITITEEL